MSLLVVSVLYFSTTIVVQAAQLDIAGPAGSVAFGAHVAGILTNGNIVVADPQGVVSSVGAVYLYDPSGSLISVVTGSTANDDVGSGGIRRVGNGDFVFISPDWGGGKGAVTWVDGASGLSGVVSSSNSLVGSTPGDHVGSGSIIVLTNGNYVVISPGWTNGAAAGAGAATWEDGSIVGAVSSGNSLVGTQSNDQVPSLVTALTNGNYVVSSYCWANASATCAGAATLGNGTTGTTGAVSAGNSLVGVNSGDHVGQGVTALANGNYVVGSPDWNGGAGAATWGDGTSGVTGIVSGINSLIGANAGDEVGYSVRPLVNGNYVVTSPFWANGSATSAGAATWADGTTGITGQISASNSLVGTTTGDQVGHSYAFDLFNGNYVVGSPYWDNGSTTDVGAATWADGTVGITGAVSTANSLVGTNSGDEVGFFVTPLSNGNYVVQSVNWANGSTLNAGAATWADGTTGIKGEVSASNSLVGTHTGDHVGDFGSRFLSNGNYVVASPAWNGNIGAATWGDGTHGTIGPVSTINSLVGTDPGDYVGGDVAAVTNGNYVVISPSWKSGTGAVTWRNGATAGPGVVSAGNSLVGSTTGDMVGNFFVSPYVYGYYIVWSATWQNTGALTVANGASALYGTIQPWNSVIGTAAGGGADMSFSSDPMIGGFVVGRPDDNIVSVFTIDLVFENNFEQ